MSKIAIATSDGFTVNEHFGHAKFFRVYELTESGHKFLEVRDAVAACQHSLGHDTTRFDKIIELLNQREKPMAFILWGSPARRKKAMITNPKHFIVESPHPSPLSAFRGFFGSRPFSRVNEFLQSTGQEPINWQLPNI